MASKEFPDAAVLPGEQRPAWSLRPRDRAFLLTLARKLRESETALRVMRETFRLFQRIGISVSPNHYYWPVPDFQDLERRPWPKDQAPIGFDLAIDKQLAFLQEVVPRYERE